MLQLILDLRRGLYACRVALKGTPHADPPELTEWCWLAAHVSDLAQHGGYQRNGQQCLTQAPKSLLQHRRKKSTAGGMHQWQKQHAHLQARRWHVDLIGIGWQCAMRLARTVCVLLPSFFGPALDSMRSSQLLIWYALSFCWKVIVACSLHYSWFSFAV